MKRPLDRGAELQGQNRSVRDHRVPYTNPREIVNYTLVDGKPRRRLGYGAVHTPVKTQALCKGTGVTYNKRLVESDNTKGIVATSPLSYGLIRWQTDYQLRRAEPKTIEFMVRLGDKEELVTNNFSRRAFHTGQWNTVFRGGVYLIDQTLLSNNHIFNDGLILHNLLGVGATFNMGAFLGATFDALPLNAMSFYFDEDNLYFSFGMVESTGANIGRYWRGFLLAPWPTTPYNVGDTYHVALTYDPAAGAGPGRFLLYINGVQAQILDIPATVETFLFVGEYDVINGVTYANGQKRDLVLLNECTARASYSSACKIRADMHGHQTFFHDFSVAPNDGINPWCLSPPRGTAMWDLRIWNVVKDASELANELSFKRVGSGEDDLKGNWYLNEGGPVCTNHVQNREKHYCTLHHGYPGYIDVNGMLNDRGVKLGDGQHIIKSVGKSDTLFGSGFAAQLGNMLTDTVLASAYLKHRDQHSFSVMMQIMVPDAFQPELNDNAADPLTMRDLALVENRRFMNTGHTFYDSLHDGNAEANASNRNKIGHATDPVVGPDTNQHLRAYDQTLWSIEGTQKMDTAGVTSEPHRRRIPLARGILTPTGQVGFELFKTQTGVLAPKYLRLVGTTPLSIGVIYTLTFVQRVNYVYNAGTQKLDADGWVMEIWIHQNGASPPISPHVSHTIAGASTITTGPVLHDNIYDVIIGSSYVNDGWDNSINMPFPNGVVATNKTIWIPAPSTARTDHGPWPVQQRFMSPYQDQPGNFVVSMFRLWTSALPLSSIQQFGNALLEEKDQSVDLIANLEFTEVTGVDIQNNSKYPDTFRMGYKGWGAPQGYRNQIFQTASLNAYLKKEVFEGAWAYEDGLGYMPITSEEYTPLEGVDYTHIEGILPFKSSTKLGYGVVTFYDDAPAFSANVDGVYVPLFLPNHGLLSEVLPTGNWKGTLVGDRTFLTSKNALPKVFNGKTISTVGFKTWTGGVPIAYATTAVAGAGLTVDRWYGIAVVYFSEKYGIYHVSPIITLKILAAGGGAIGLYMIPPHPDNRVSAIEVYRTLPQVSEDLALNAPLFKTKISTGGVTLGETVFGGNVYCESAIIEDPDANLPNAILDRNVTPFPPCAFSASLNEQLYLTGDPANPDLVYFSDSGNPERIDALFNSVKLPESSGDASTGMIGAFGTILVFKPNGIWRIDSVGGGRFQPTKVATIGAVAEKSIYTFNDPDSGRTWVFFWSQHGPYLFDGNTPIYVGYPLEESEYEGTTREAYSWLNPSSVVVGHNAPNRELICFFTPVIKTGPSSNLVTLDRNGRAMVFNYRRRVWYEYRGVIGSQALSLSFSRESDIVYKLLLGGEHGRLYSWGETAQDALPVGTTQAQGFVILQDVGGGVYEFATLPSTDLIGSWLTLYHSLSGNWISAPIVNVSGLFVTVNPEWFGNEAFPITDTAVTSFFQPPAWIRFPWDELDMPYYDKQLIELIVWTDAVLHYRMQYNYLPLVVPPQLQDKYYWKRLQDMDNRKRRVQINRSLESVKLELMSRDLGSSIDAMLYQIDQKQGAEVSQ